MGSMDTACQRRLDVAHGLLSEWRAARTVRASRADHAYFIFRGNCTISIKGSFLIIAFKVWKGDIAKLI